MHAVRGKTVVRIIGFAAAGALGVGVAFAASGPILKVSHAPNLGAIVVDGKGLTLYHVQSEKNGRLTCTGNCLYYWFPVTVKSKAAIVLGPGLSKAKIGTVKRPGGALQVTYNKLPLYRYYLDRKPGQMKGQGEKDPAGTWYVVSTSGKVVTKKPGGTGTGTGSTATTTTVGIGY
jgi:predicted lipoprotein with Yx(FWY)xxD motif